jgi:hypothetical protein
MGASKTRLSHNAESMRQEADDKQAKSERYYGKTDYQRLLAGSSFGSGRRFMAPRCRFG